MAKIITVFGATGRQGKAVAFALAKNKNFHVRACTRDMNDPKFRHLVDNGVDVLPVNLEDVNSIRMALSGAYGCFVVTYTDFCDPECIKKETDIGKNITDAIQIEGIEHVVYSTQMNTLAIMGFAVRHFCAKAEVGDYMIEKKLKVTNIMVPPYYEDMYDVFKPKRVGERNFDIAMPMGNTPLNLISVEDIGEVVSVIFNNRQTFINKTISVSGDKLLIKEIAAILTRCLSPLLFRDQQITLSDFREMNFPGAPDWATMFTFFQRVDQQYNVIETRKINPALKSFENWATLNSEKLKNTFLS